MPSVDVVHAAQVDAPGSTSTSASPWVVMTSPDPSSVTDYLNGVSCVQQFCMAVGNQGALGGIAPLAEAWDGATWEVVPMLDPNGAGPANGSPKLTLVNGVSCAAPSFCVAVGESNFTGRWTTLAERWGGASWSIMPSGDTPSFEDYLLSVACPSTHSCTAVGSYTNGHAGQLNGTLVEDMGDGGSFSIVASPDQALSLGGLSTPANHLFSVSCPGTGPFCASVGYSEKETTDGGPLPREALAESSRGGAWSLLQAAGRGVSNQLNSVSCASATSCTAVGWSDTAGDVQPLIESWDGQTWTTVRAPAGGTSLDGVSCLGTGTCAAVGRHGLVDSWDGKTWSVVPTPQQAGTSRNLHAVSCMSGTCTAVGSTTSSSGTTTTLIEQACSATSAGAPEATRAVREQAQIGADATGISACPLKVYVRVLEHIRSGLAVDNGYPSEGPVNFTVNTYGGKNGSVYAAPGQEGQKCMSGCANVLITVIDPATHKPVVGATVNATVDPIAKLELETAPGYDGVASTTSHFGRPLVPHDNEFLCPQTDNVPGQPLSHCGTALPDLTTDDKGQVRLIYWAPGLVDTAQTTLDVSAKETCTKEVCSARAKEGSATPTKLIVRPYLIYGTTGQLTEEQVGDLTRIVRESAALSLLATEAAKHGFEKIWAPGFNWLVAKEVAAVLASHAASVLFSEAIFGALEIKEMSEADQEEDELIGSFLKTLGLPAIGLWPAEPLEIKASAAPSYELRQRILYDVGWRKYTGASGVLWDDAAALNDQFSQTRGGRGRKTYFSPRPEDIRLDVYEISSCNEDHPDCGPGYLNSSGIQPELCLEFTGSDSLSNPALHFQKQLCIPYDARAFVQTMQRQLNPALP